MSQPTALPSAEQIKHCCANLYASDWIRLLLGDSLHPGGLDLTERLGEHLGLQPRKRLLDVATGRGASAIHLARRAGCEVVGVDFSPENITAATRAASEAGLSERVHFLPGDAERLPVEDGGFDAVMAECAFCTFPDKQRAATEFARVIRPDGRVGLSDLVRSGPLPSELEGLLGWISCIADARPIEEYRAFLLSAGLTVERVERHDDALVRLVEVIRTRLHMAQLAARLASLSIPGVDWDRARVMLGSAARAVADGVLATR
jgi:arsenite methyltransferase